MARLISDIKYEGSSSAVVWKSPIEDFETGSVITVFESQTALFYLNGACVGELNAGRHILETENIPFLNRLFAKIAGNKNVFHAQIYFVNNAEMLSMKWGVGNIVYQDTSGIVFEIGCNGEINLSVDKPRYIVEKLAALGSDVTGDMLVDRFRGLIASEVTDTLVNTIIDKNIPIINVTSHLKVLSQSVKPYIEDIFEEYGFNVPQFRIIKVLMPENDPQFRRLKALEADKGLLMSELELRRQAELLRAQTKAQAEMVAAQTEAQKIKLEADALAFKRSTEGYTYQQERQFDVLKSAVENTGSSSAAGMSGEFMQLGAGLGVMGVVGDMMKNNMNVMSGAFNTQEQPALTCPKCGQPYTKGAKFCFNCGQKLTETDDSIVCVNCKNKTPKGKFCINCGKNPEKEE